MKITIEPTAALVELVGENGHGVPARVWEGTTEDGVPVVVFVTRISPQTHDEAVNQRFAAELVSTRQPSFEPFVSGVPLRLIL